MNLEQMLDKLVDTEGGYVNDPKDSGGETNWGVTIAVARAFGYTGRMIDMTQMQAREIYRQRYWIQPRFNEIGKINAAIAEELFDTGVNMGQSRAGTFLQRALNVLNREGKSFPDISADGSVGNMTLAALKAYLDLRKQDGAKVLLRMLNAQQGDKYISLAEARSKDEEYVFGWFLNRVEI